MVQVRLARVGRVESVAHIRGMRRHCTGLVVRPERGALIDHSRRRTRRCPRGVAVLKPVVKRSSIGQRSNRTKLAKTWELTRIPVPGITIIGSKPPEMNDRRGAQASASAPVAGGPARVRGRRSTPTRYQREASRGSPSFRAVLLLRTPGQPQPEPRRHGDVQPDEGDHGPAHLQAYRLDMGPSPLVQQPLASKRSAHHSPESAAASDRAGEGGHHRSACRSCCGPDYDIRNWKTTAIRQTIAGVWECGRRSPRRVGSVACVAPG